MIAPESQRRWFHPTPGHLLLVLLVAEGILLFANWMQWIPKGWSVLIAVASVGLFLSGMLLWLVVALIFHRQFQFSLRSILVLTVAVAVLCSWLTVEMKKAREQSEAVEALIKLSGTVGYDYEPNEFMGVPDRTPPEWMQNVFGNDFFGRVDFIFLYKKKVTDDDLQTLKELKQARTVSLGSTKITDSGLECIKEMISLEILVLSNTQITDSGLKRLSGLKHLWRLELTGTKVTDAGVAKLQKALPNLQILR